MGKEDLQQQFVSLQDVFAQLGTQLDEVCEQLAASGTLPPAELSEALGTARLEFEALRGKVLTAAKFLELHPLPELDDIASLQALESLLHTVLHAGEAMEAAEDTRQRALTVVERVLTLAHCDHDPYAPLLEVQNKARDLHTAIAMAQWTDLPAETQVLADGQHPFTALLSLVELREGLDDDQWMTLQDCTAQSYGHPIAVPAARGKFFLTETAVAVGRSTSDDTDDAIDSRLTHGIGHATSSVIQHEQTAAQEDADSLLAGSDDHVQASDTTDRDVDALPSAVEQDMADVQVSDGGDAPPMPDEEGQYNQQLITPADLDRFLREQIRAVRKETQEETSIRSLRQRIR